MEDSFNDERVTTDKLMRDLHTVMADAEALLKATSSQAGDKIQEARARAEQSLAAVRERLSGVEDEAMRQTRELVNEGEEYVRQNPWAAVGIAAGVGLLLGMILGRR